MKKNILTIKNFSMDDVVLDDEYKINSHSLQIPRKYLETVPKGVEKISIKVLSPKDCHIKTNTIMDIIPISTKVLGNIGDGLSHTLTGVSVILTGAYDSGIQLHEFGSSEGYLDEKIKFNRSGTPDINDKLILFDVTLNEELPFNRTTCNLVFSLLDNYLQPIREEMKMLDGTEAFESFTFEDKPNIGKPKVALVKEIAGQGAMYDNSLFATEPAGFKENVSIIDMSNMPVLLTANEYRDGVLHALV